MEGDAEQMRMLTLIRRQKAALDLLCSQVAFSLVREEKTRRSNRRCKAGLGRDASGSGDVLFKKNARVTEIYFLGWPSSTHTTALCVPNLHNTDDKSCTAVEYCGIRRMPLATTTNRPNFDLLIR